MTAGCCARRARGLGHMQPLARLHLVAGNPVPAAQLIQRDAKSISDGHQRVALAHRVDSRMRRLGNRRRWHKQRLSISDAFVYAQMIGRGQRRFRDAILERH